MGRGIVIRGRWAEPDEAPREAPRPKMMLAVPFDFPGWALNDWTMRAFNFVFFNKHGAGVKRGVVHPQR